jgi:formate dehydrogenase major subunit
MEAHPVGSRWAMKARERGAKIIHVDPHFSRTSAAADLYVPIRAGTDIAFLGGLIHHILETESYFRDYVVHYTNASMILRDDFADAEDLGGLFSGFDPETGTYDRTTWMFEGGDPDQTASEEHQSTHAFTEKTGGEDPHAIPRDPTLEHPRCVFQVLKRHYARYTPEMVERICGTPKELFTQVAETLIANSGRERTTMLAYAVGWTQHSAGVQIIRAGTIVQLLIGNVGRPGGGIMAMRGHASIQGSTDIPTLYEILPGYLPMPRAQEEDQTLESYVEGSGRRKGWWSHFDEYIVSLLKAWFGDAATPESDFGFAHLPKLTGNHSHYPTMLRALDGGLDGLFVMGQNPAVGSIHSGLQRRALAALRWLVVRDLTDLETAFFWRDSPEIRSGELRTEDIGTEVFLMPCAGHVEKAGHFTNTQRLLQWRDKAIDPPGDARSELHFMFHLGRRLKAHYADSERERDWPMRHLAWDYTVEGPQEEPDPEEVLREISGFEVATGREVDGFPDLKADGSTACGCWIYSGCFAGGVNQTRRRDPGDLEAPGGWVSPEWGWAWPANRRILYNRASADPSGRPWSERKRFIWWDESAGDWAGYDVPDFPPGLRPDYRPGEEAEGMDAIAGDAPFIMMPDGRAHLYSASGLLDAPLPTHYEPLESPVRNELYPEIGSNPVALTWARPENPLEGPEDDRWPHVASTFRLTEHHTAGPMSRNLPWLAELQPEMFAEIDPELAAEKGIEDGGWMVIETSRAEIEARAKVTNRVRPLIVGGRRLHQVCMPWHFGTFTSNEQGVVGDSANDLAAITGDPNVSIQESKAFRCNIRAGRRDQETTARLAGIDSTPEPGDPGSAHPAERPSREGQHYQYGRENREI